MNIELLNPIIEEDQYCWLVKLGELRLGANDQGAWCMQRQNGNVFYFDFPGCYVPLEPILEFEYRELFSFLQKAAATHSKFAEAILNFPTLPLVKHTLNTAYSEYWPSKALAWLAVDIGILPHLKDELKRFSENKVMGQVARQQAKRLLRAA